jgi:quercetin dioxygenase-like cupin family protein
VERAKMTESPVVTTGEGVTRQVLADHPNLMVVAFRFANAGAEGSLHSHPHVQSTYVESGRFRFSLGDEVRDVGPGDSFVIPSEMRHGCVCLEPGMLVDCFTPRRDDFL